MRSPLQSDLNSHAPKEGGFVATSDGMGNNDAVDAEPPEPPEPLSASVGASAGFSGTTSAAARFLSR